MTKLVQGLGIVGDGNHRPSVNGSKTKAYNSWVSILRTVKDGNATVSDEWLNYQNFAQWYNSQQKGDDWKLSNSFLTNGNHYGVETCAFVPAIIQQQFSLRKNDRGDVPVGLRKIGKRYGVRLTVAGKMKSYGTYDSVEEAFVEYKELKETYVKSLANEYKDSLSDLAYDGLMQWSVDIND